MRLQGLQTQHRQRLGDDAAHADAGLFGVARQLQRRFGQRFADQCCRRRRQRRQREQARDDRRIATHLQRTELVPFEIDVPRSVCRGTTRLAAGSGINTGSWRPSPLARQPTVAGRAAASSKGEKSSLRHNRPVSAISCSASPPCRGVRPKARKPVSKERSAHNRRRIGRSSSLTKRGGLLSARSMLHSSSALSGSRPLRTVTPKPRASGVQCRT
jgi:hypothetical protein